MTPPLDYLRVIHKYRPDARYYPRALLYLFKACVWEPFRYAEAAIERFRRESRVLPHQPLFILGYYRSGTTHLQETLLRDPQFGYMNFFHCFFPTAFTITEPVLKPFCERVVRAIDMVHPAHGIPFSFELPAEEDVSMVAAGSRLAANWGQTLPRSFKEIYRTTGLLEDISPEDRAALKDHLADLFWRVSRSNGHKRLVLKSPPQLGRVALLAELYPEARFIFIRRNPYDVFASNKKLWKSFEKTWLQDVDAETVRDYILWNHDACHRAYERDKKLLAGRLCEISFENFQAAPLATLRRIYETLDLGDFSTALPAFETYLEKMHKETLPPYPFTAVELEAVRTRLGKWIDEWGYSAPLSEAAP